MKNSIQRHPKTTLVTVLMILVSGHFLFSFQRVEKVKTNWTEYYPLAVGNKWIYTAKKPNETHSKQIMWDVTNKLNNQDGDIFAVWPKPIDTDDSGMQLQFTNEGLKELIDDFYILRFPLSNGMSWEASHGRVFRVLAVGNMCTVGKYSFKQCLIVEDIDPQASLRTVTTYARSVGPVRFVYYKISDTHPANKPMNNMDIASYHISNKVSSTIKK